ncbi:MAG: tetratricopeptide repeat protein [Thermodesulfobacteriota bacterium]
MYTKILLVIIVCILGAFFYLHTQNPTEVTLVFMQDRSVTFPVTLFIFGGFFLGAFLAVVNSLVVDTRRYFRDVKARRERKAAEAAEENYHRGVELLVKGDTAGARGVIEKAIATKPADAGMIISLSETYARENRPSEALRVLEKGYLENPNSIGILVATARSAAASGDEARAARAYEEVVKLDPKNSFALKKLRDYKMKTGDWAKAAALQKAVLECERDEEAKDGGRRLLNGLLYEAAAKRYGEGSYEDALSVVKEVIKNNEDFLPAHVLHGEILYGQGNTSGAVKVWEKALQMFPNAEPFILKLEEVFLKESAPEKILEEYQKEIIAHPADTNLRLLLSRLYLRLEMIDNAIEELERLHQEGVDSFYSRILLGEAYMRRKLDGKAAELFQKALGLDREFVPPFVCSHCGHNVAAWAPRCPSCGEWNTLLMAISSATAAVR